MDPPDHLAALQRVVEGDDAALPHQLEAQLEVGVVPGLRRLYSVCNVQFTVTSQLSIFCENFPEVLLTALMQDAHLVGVDECEVEGVLLPGGHQLGEGVGRGGDGQLDLVLHPRLAPERPPDCRELRSVMYYLSPRIFAAPPPR